MMRQAFSHSVQEPGRALRYRSAMVSPMMEADVKAWDIAPFKILFEEAGGRFTDLAGRPTIHSGTALATNGRLHDEALALLVG